MNSKKLISLSEAESLEISEIWSLYDNYVNKGLRKIFSLFSFGKDVFTKAQGMYLYTSDGKKILDFTGGIGVLNHGHNHEDIINARISYQQKQKPEVHKIIFSPYTAVLSHNIAKLMPGDLNKCFFPNSGAEAVEGALKLAYKFHKGTRDYVLHSNISFHGKLIATGAISGNYPECDDFQPMPFNHEYEFNNINSVKTALNYLKKNGTSNVYALIIEPYSSSSFQPAEKEFLIELREICDEQNIILIFDEVYTGWGKTGSLFYFMRYENLIPDIVTMSKSFGGGKASIACYVTRDLIHDKAYNSISEAPKHSSTYSGFGEEAATAIEAVRIAYEEDYSKKANNINQMLHAKLALLKSDYPKIIKDIRGVGALNCIDIGIPIDSVEKSIKKSHLEFLKDKYQTISKIVAASIMEEMYSTHGILVSTGERKIFSKEKNMNEYMLYILATPSCIAKEDHINQFVDALRKTLKKGLIMLVASFILKNIK